MDSDDLLALTTAIDWLAAGHKVVLATVVKTWGSSPRPCGAWAAFRNDGLIAGSVSGGCIEDDLLRRISAPAWKLERPEYVSYGVSGEDAARFGLPCGGTLKLLLESADLGLLRDLHARLTRQQLVLRTLDIASGRSVLAAAQGNEQICSDDTRLQTLHGPRWRLLIIGAVQMSQHLASMALALDYAVTVCDPREEYQQTWRVGGVHLVRDMPDDAVLALQPDSRSAIVALTHDPKLDDLALIDALRSPAFYVGALGSRANQKKRKARLQEHFGLSEAELARLHGPVGLAIGSRTPAEIAVSILAEMTAVKHGIALAAGTLQAQPATPATNCA